MFQTPQQALKPNPFTTHRDPETGRWIVVLTDAARLSQDCSSVSQSSVSQSSTSQYCNTATARLSRKSALFSSQLRPVSAGSTHSIRAASAVPSS